MGSLNAFWWGESIFHEVSVGNVSGEVFRGKLRKAVKWV